GGRHASSSAECAPTPGPAVISPSRGVPWIDGANVPGREFWWSARCHVTRGGPTPMSKPRLNGFEFLECLGQGGFGQVWKVRDLGLDAVRAVKLVDPARFREQDVRRLLAEARAVARLPNHRNRVVVHQVKDGVTNCFLIMDYVAGGSLDRLISPGEP